ncbi:MAG: hypothetical protein QG604_404 [Candidatus Dependentiae bacterium]|nr:hypothetical protein [Candidatus Dependentiae bacterium]
MVSLRNTVLRNSLVACTLSLFAPLFGTGYRSSPPSEEILLSNFCQKILNDDSVTLSPSELANDVAIIGPSLSQLLSFAWQRPALEQALFECMRTLLVRNTRTVHDKISVKKMHVAALTECQKEFNFFCETNPDSEMVASSLRNLGLYYGPMTMMSEDSTSDQFNNSLARKGIVIGLSAGAIALLILAARALTSE